LEKYNKGLTASKLTEEKEEEKTILLFKY